MKNILSFIQFTWIFLALIFSFSLFSSCESTGAETNKSSAEKTMKSFIEKVTAKDFDGAKEFASNRTDKTLETLKRAQIMFKEMNKEDQNKMSFRGVDFNQKVTVKCTTKDDKTTCECCEEITGNCQNIAVIQENGKWLVDQPKESNVE
jgi:hypothetical protein